MSDLSGDARFLKYHYASEESLMDKDYQKNEKYRQLVSAVGGLFMYPTILQFAQIYYVNVPEKAALY